MDRTFSRHEARGQFGQKFVDIMMRDRATISISDEQIAKASLWKMLHEGKFRPFSYDYVYVMSNGRGQVKVGFTMSPPSRLAAMQTGSADSLSFSDIIVCRAGGGRNIEKAAHRMLKGRSKHIRGEWFSEEGVVEMVREMVDLKYQTTCIHLEAAWEGAEKMVGIARKALSDDERALEQMSLDRSNFLYVATLMRLKGRG